MRVLVKTTKLKLITILNYFELWNTIKVSKPNPRPAVAIPAREEERSKIKEDVLKDQINKQNSRKLLSGV